MSAYRIPLIILGTIISVTFVSYSLWFYNSHKTDSLSYPNLVSELPRNRIVTYVVEKGDTLAGIASKWAISEDTIRWANDLQTTTVIPGQVLSILPVSGVAHVVAKGETVESIAVLYGVDPQKIITYPYNTFRDINRHELIVGNTIIVPDGKHK